jgi:DNA (cytosine-5)-methyltransferase 1
MPDIEEYVTTEEAAEILGYSPKYIRRMLRNGKLPAEKVGRLWLIHRDTVREYQEAVKGMDKNDPRRGDDLRAFS